MIHDNHKQTGLRTNDIQADLAELSKSLSRRNYPGLAWPARGGKRRWTSLSTWIPAAAAAAILVAIILTPGPDKQRKTAPPKQDNPEQIDTGDFGQTIAWSVPMIDPSIAGRVKLDIPKVTILSKSEAGGLHWNIPTINFPSSPKWRNNNES